MITGQHHRDQQAEVRHRFRLRGSTCLELVAQPLAVQEIAGRREPPRANLGLDDNGELDRAGPVHVTGDPEQSFEERPSLPIVHAPPGNDENVHIAGGLEAAEHGGSVEIDTDGLAAERLADQPHNLPDPVHYPQCLPPAAGPCGTAMRTYAARAAFKDVTCTRVSGMHQ